MGEDKVEKKEVKTEKEQNLLGFIEGQKARTEKVLEKLHLRAKEYQEKLDGITTKIGELTAAVEGFRKTALELKAKEKAK